MDVDHLQQVIEHQFFNLLSGAHINPCAGQSGNLAGFVRRCLYSTYTVVIKADRHSVFIKHHGRPLIGVESDGTIHTLSFDAGKYAFDIDLPDLISVQDPCTEKQGVSTHGKICSHAINIDLTTCAIDFIKQ